MTVTDDKYIFQKKAFAFTLDGEPTKSIFLYLVHVEKL